MNKIYLTLIAAAALGMTASAEVKLPRLLADGMVVQRGAPVAVWGTADPGEEVTVTAADSRNKAVGAKKGYKAVAGADGRWQLELPALKPGGPYTLTINGKQIKDVLRGDVFLCSGQSNMELPVKRVTEMFGAETSAYSNDLVRHFNVPMRPEFHGPQTDLRGGAWKSVKPENAGNFSALAYFFANDYQRRTGVPVGIINSSCGGTPVETWMSDEAIAPYPRAVNQKRIYDDDAYRAAVKKVESQNYYRWDLALYRGDPGLHGEVKWNDELDDSSWKTVDLPDDSSWSRDGYNAANGSHWFRKDINLTAGQAAGDATLRLGCLVDADSVYVNGTLVGATTYRYPPRIYPVPAKVLKEGRNNITVRLISKSGNPSFVPDKPYKLITKEGDIDLKGQWRYRRGAPMVAGPSMEFYHYKPVVLYNSMIAPLAPLHFAGAVWYQGESNVSRRNEYESLLKDMIADWRKTLGEPQLPFYIVELADYLHPSDTGGRAAWAEMRAVQAKVAADTPNAFLIKNSDLGEWNDIHPLDKKTLGVRVADAAINTSTQCKAK